MWSKGVTSPYKKKNPKLNDFTKIAYTTKEEEEEQTLYTPSWRLATSALCYRLTNVFDAEGVGLRLLALVIPIAYIPCVFPPLVV